MTTKGQLLQDPFLNSLRKEHIPVSIYLVNGIKLQGQIESFDQYVILLRNTVTQMVYKHAISTVVPTRSVSMNGELENRDQYFRLIHNARFIPRVLFWYLSLLGGPSTTTPLKSLRC